MEMDFYYRSDCPYSQKVLQHLRDKELDPAVSFHEIRFEPQARELLEEMNGSPQVPCLVSGGIPILESENIIRFLDESVVETKAS